MLRKPVLCTLVAVLTLSGTAWAAGEELTYSGPFVSVNGPLRLCATAARTNAGIDLVPGVGLWFQAWDLAGNPRTNGPLGTVYTNVLGKACTQYNLLAGLYEVQAFGTGDFDGVASPTVVVSNYKSSQVNSVTSAGIAEFGWSPMTPARQAPFGLLLGGIHSGATMFYTGRNTKTLRAYVPLLGSDSQGRIRRFHWLDPFNPNGPTQVDAAYFRTTSIALVTPIGNLRLAQIIASVEGWCYVKVGNCAPIQAWMSLRVDTMLPFKPPLVLVTNVYDPICLNDGFFALRVIGLYGQVIYDVEGTFRGQTCIDFAPPPPP